MGSGKANTKPTRRGVGEEGLRGHEAGRRERGPARVLRPRPVRPSWPAGRSAVVLAGVEAGGRALQAAVAERRVLLGLEPQAG